MVWHELSYISVLVTKWYSKYWRSYNHFRVKFIFWSHDLDLWLVILKFESPYFIQDEHRRIHFKAHCYVTDVIVMIIMVYDLIGYQDNEFQALV